MQLSTSDQTISQTTHRLLCKLRHPLLLNTVPVPELTRFISSLRPPPLRFKDPSSYCASSNNALNGNPNRRQPRNALLETHLPMTEETTENFLRRGMGRSELQPGKRRSEGNSLEEGEEAAAGGSSSAAALGGWVDWTGLGRHRLSECRSSV